MYKEKVNKYCDVEAMKFFLENYEAFFRENFKEVFKEEVFKAINGKKIRLNDISKVDLCVRPQSQSKVAYDLNFACSISYTHYFEYDLSSDSWIENKEKYLDNYVMTDYIKGIFRNVVTFPHHALIDRLIRTDIKFLCLREYNGSLSKQEFIKAMKNAGLYILFV